MWNFRSARIKEPLQVFHMRFFCTFPNAGQQEGELCPQARQQHSQGSVEVQSLAGALLANPHISFAAAHLSTNSRQVLIEKTHGMPDKKTPWIL